MGDLLPENLSIGTVLLFMALAYLSAFVGRVATGSWEFLKFWHNRGKSLTRLAASSEKLLELVEKELPDDGAPLKEQMRQLKRATEELKELAVDNKTAISELKGHWHDGHGEKPKMQNRREHSRDD